MKKYKKQLIVISIILFLVLISSRNLIKLIISTFGKGEFNFWTLPYMLKEKLHLIFSIFFPADVIPTAVVGVVLNCIYFFIGITFMFLFQDKF